MTFDEFVKEIMDLGVLPGDDITVYVIDVNSDGEQSNLRTISLFAVERSPNQGPTIKFCEA